MVGRRLARPSLPRMVVMCGGCGESRHAYQASREGTSAETECRLPHREATDGLLHGWVASLMGCFTDGLLRLRFTFSGSTNNLSNTFTVICEISCFGRGVHRALSVIKQSSTSTCCPRIQGSGTALARRSRSMVQNERVVDWPIHTHTTRSF